MDSATDAYVLDQQVGHLLRRANQRHTALFARTTDISPVAAVYSSSSRAGSC
jgi:hypothetical protein